MKRRLLFVLCLGAAIALTACSGDEGQECGEGTVASGDQCVSDAEEIECGEGTELQDGVCVNIVEAVECGEGTVLMGGECVSEIEAVDCGPNTELVDGECVSTVEEVECAAGTTLVDGECVADAACGPDTELVDGECISTIGCGDGTILVDGACELIDPFDGIDREADEPNDPAFYGDDANIGTLELGAEGETSLVYGNIDAPSTVGEDEDTFLAADFDIVVFQGTAGQRINLESTAIGAPSIAMGLVFLADEGDDRSFVRLAFPHGSRNASKQVVLPFTGAYMVRVGAPNDTAAFFSFLSEGQLNFGSIVGEPEGHEDFTWILGVTHLAPAAPETFTGNATFSFTGDDVREAPEALLEVDAGKIVQLSLEVGPGTAGAFLTGNTAFDAVDENLGLVVVPEGGLRIVVDSVFERTTDPSFTLSGIELPQIAQGDLAPGGSFDYDGTLVGNSIQFLPFTATENSIITASAGPGEDSDANVAIFLLSADLSETIAVSSDGVFGLPSNEENLQGYVAAGDYQLAVFHENQDDDNGDHPFTVSVSATGVTTLDDLAVDGTQTVTDMTLGAEGAIAWYVVNTTELGLFGASATPVAETGIDAAMRIFTQPFLAARDQVLAAAEVDDGAAAEAESAELPLAAGTVIFAVGNLGELAEADFNVDVAVSLLGIAQETEPNDVSGDANSLGALEGVVRVAGALAADVDTTTDFYSFTLDGIAEVNLGVIGVGEAPASGLRMNLYTMGNPNTPIASAETIVDFFSGEEIDPTIDTVLEGGSYFVSVEQIEDTPTGDYLVTLTRGETLECVPGVSACNEGAVETCIDGFDIEVIECDVECVEVGGVFGCELVAEVEPNDEEAQMLGDARDIVGNLSPEDEDRYSFTVDSNARLTASTAFSVAPGADTTLALEDGEGEQIAFNDDTNGLFSEITANLTPGTYTLVVRGFGGGAGNYRLILDLELAQCEGDAAECGEDGNIYACDGFELVIAEECGFGCELFEDEPICTIPDFIPEVEPNGGFVDNALEFNTVEELPYVGFGEIRDEGTDQDYYLVDLSFGDFDAWGVSFETTPAGNDDDVDTRIFICTLDQVFGGDCRYFGDNVGQDDDGGEGTYSALSAQLEPALYFFVVESFSTRQGEYLVNIDAEGLIINEYVEEESNDSAGEAQTIEFFASVEGTVDPGTETDWYAFEIDTAGTVGTFRTARRNGGVDTQMFLCSSADPDNCSYNSGDLDSDDDGGGSLQSLIEYTFDEAGTYYIVVQSFSTGTGDYTLTADASVPED